MVRPTSEERREQVIDAAVKEFAAHGYHATSTTAIAERAGISQPYIYALFPNKHELFLAAHPWVVDRIRAAFAEAAAGLPTPEERLDAMGNAYMELLENREEILFQHPGARRRRRPGAAGVGPAEFMRLIDDVGA